jgi:hypothetical protein
MADAVLPFMRMTMKNRGFRSTRTAAHALLWRETTASNFPVAGLRPQIDLGRALGYVNVVGYFRNPGFLGGRPFVPLFMAPGQA